VALQFSIQPASAHDYCGFERWLSVAQTWSGYDELCITADSTGTADEVVVQFGEASGEVWKSWTPVSALGAGEYCLPLSTSTFSWADWSVQQNGRIDLGAIDYYGIYVHGAQGAQGVLYVEQLRVVER